ncbi:hypothetical protein HCY66_11405 [Acinetobacter radioresistens]|uniref:hypothetical protein n=1 Tax=Acinetobacter radioresistens TaxID=40216 RepID=UPI002004A584|nr:hypothetical protein [Acinetobacter radioresistens]MCK4090672.1 hypothetical protein [Acinetobacter radioresistens]
MNPGQELTHLVKTTINANTQSIENETIFKEGEDIILHSKHEVNIPIGAVYDISISGDVNSDTLVRTLNTMNNLAGSNAFRFINENDATDIDAIKFGASYDSVLKTFTGSAPVNTTVRVVFEDGKSRTATPDSLGAWSLAITEDDLQYGGNTIILINGTRQDQIITINIERVAPVNPFNPNFTYAVNPLGTGATGTVLDARAIIKIFVNDQEYSVKPAQDKTWICLFDTPLKHLDSLSFNVEYQEITGQEEEFIFYKNSAVLDVLKGQTITGTTRPLTNVQIKTSTYDPLLTIADDSGLWTISFAHGLAQGEQVDVYFDEVKYTSFNYTGKPNVKYELTARIDSTNAISGTGKPGETITVYAGDNPVFNLTVNSEGQWSTVLEITLKHGQDVTVITPAGERISVEYLVEANPSEPPLESQGLTAYISADGSKIYGKSLYETVSIQLPGESEAILGPVTQGMWDLFLQTPLQPGDVVTISSGQAMQTVQFIEIQTFTAELNSTRDKLIGVTDLGIKATVRIVFDDNSLIEQPVTGGAYEIELGRMVDPVNAIVVSCTNEYGVTTLINIS